MPDEMDNPILNGPYDPPSRYFEIGPGGPTGEVRAGRRRSESWVPVPVSRKGGRQPVQEGLDFDITGERREANSLINDVRQAVERWRQTYDGVTPITRKLLQHWSDPSRGEGRVPLGPRGVYTARVVGEPWAGQDGQNAAPRFKERYFTATHATPSCRICKLALEPGEAGARLGYRGVRHLDCKARATPRPR